MTAALYDTLREITTATITTMLLKKGIRRCWMDGPQPLVPGGQRLVGPAFTLRFVPVREDLATPESWSKPISTRGAIEAMPEGCIAVADAMGVGSAGIFGDILTMRMMKRNVTALVTDGVIRDKAGVLASRLPVWCAGVAAPASVNGLTFVGWEEPIACGGCAIFPGDVIVCDDDGAVVIPQNLVGFVAEEGAEHERMETWIVSEVERGAKLPGLYPMNDETKARYQAWKKTSSLLDGRRRACSSSSPKSSASLPSRPTSSFRSVLLGLLLLMTRFARAGRWLVVASLVVLAVLGLSPIGNALIIPLEQRFPPWDGARGTPDGIIVLGGAISPDVSAARNDVALNELAERLTVVAELARHYPKARILFSGGSGRVDL